jgi:CheY-like chemotaxis protein
MAMSEHGEVPASGAEHARLVALGQVAGELMHDLANLVEVVKGRASIALGDARSGRLPTGELERLMECSDELGAMLRDVMETLQGGTLSPEVAFRPQAVAERVIRRFLDGAPPLNIQLVSFVSTELVVAGRASFFARALANLLGNAARHARGEIRLSLSSADEHGQRMLAVAVEDDGDGIPPDQAEAVFRPLVHGETGGTGLGLSSVTWAVANLGGEVRYRAGTELGGACFEILLPVREGRRTVSRVPQNLAGYRLVLIEDDSILRTAFTRLLQRMGAEVIAFYPAEKSEEEMLRDLLRAMPDAILLDIRLGPQHGVQIWKMLQSHLPALARRAIFLSGLAPGDAEWEVACATGQLVLGKPVDLDELCRAVREVTNTD